MVETRAWTANGGLPAESDKCRICRKSNSNALVISVYRTSCNGISEKTQ